MSKSRRDFLKQVGMAAAAPIVGVGLSANALTNSNHLEDKADISKIASTSYDLAVIEATPGGIACAIRAAREGLGVLLINRTMHLGGMITGGIGVLDAMFDGSRAPILDEFQRRILDFYRTKYGPNSPQYNAARPGPRLVADSRLSFESHVGEIVLNDMIAAEKNITILKGYHPRMVERTGRTLQAVTFVSETSTGTVRVTANIFVDATYTADLAAAAGVQYRIGREDRNEFNEPHAGRIFTLQRKAPDKALYPYAAVVGEIDLRPVNGASAETFAGSTGAGDAKVEAWNYRLTVSCDPANRRYPEKPANYNRQEFIDTYTENFPRIGRHQINQKATWWENLTVANYGYPDGDWPTRHKIEARYRDFALGRMYFLQTDPTVPKKRQLEALEWGLAKDEFIDNDNFPYELYVREARRIVGRYIFKEQDASLARGYDRTPVHDDSIAIADWYIDLQQVSRERQPGSSEEGLLSLAELTRPSQIPYRTLLPQDIDNLLVTVCLSSTHVGWGTIRLEPTWMHVGEAAGFAAAHARHRNLHPALISCVELQQDLTEHRLMTSFFNDFDMSTNASWVPAVNYLAAKGFFDSYNARANEPLLSSIAEDWVRSANEIETGESDGDERARRLAGAGNTGVPVKAGALCEMLAKEHAFGDRVGEAAIRAQLARQNIAGDTVVKRGDACLLIYQLLALKK
jgi:FAD dependent oxidoreductase